MYVKNEQGERLLVYVLENGEVVPKYPEDSMEGFDLTEVFCLGCSWHGSPGTYDTMQEAAGETVGFPL